jgi:hypothetical protein
MHRSLQFLRLVTATLLLSLAHPRTLIGTTPNISETLAQEPMNRDREAEAEQLEERIRDVLGNLTLPIGLDPSLGSDTTEAKKVLEAIACLPVRKIPPSSP